MKYTLFIGLNDKDTKTQLVTNQDAKRIVLNAVFASGLDGCTINEVTGFYKHQDGQTVIENTLQVLIYTDNENGIYNAANDIKILLNQETIIIEKTSIESIFI